MTLTFRICLINKNYVYIYQNAVQNWRTAEHHFTGHVKDFQVAIEAVLIDILSSAYG